MRTSPSYESIITLRKAFFLFKYNQSHFRNSARLKKIKFQLLSPHLGTWGAYFDHHLTRWNLYSSHFPSQRMPLYIFSIWLTTLVCSGNKDMKYVGKLEIILLINVILPQLDWYILSNLPTFFLSSQNCLTLEAPKGRPKYFIGEVDSLDLNCLLKLPG